MSRKNIILDEPFRCLEDVVLTHSAVASGYMDSRGKKQLLNQNKKDSFKFPVLSCTVLR